MSNRSGNGKGKNGHNCSQSNGSINGLWQSFVGCGRSDLGLRNRLVEHYSWVVTIVTSKLVTRLPLDYDDIYQMAMLGLIEAVENFDTEANVKFETFAGYRVRGSVMDELRTQDWVGRQWRQRRKILDRERGKFYSQYGRGASTQELMTLLGWPEKVINELLCHNFSVVSIDEAYRNSDDTHFEPVAREEVMAETWLDLEQVRCHLKGLSDLQRTIAMMYFDEEFSMSQIGEMLGLSESRISQIMSDVAQFLRDKFSRNEASV